jgi:hypothetical protein
VREVGREVGRTIACRWPAGVAVSSQRGGDRVDVGRQGVEQALEDALRVAERVHEHKRPTRPLPMLEVGHADAGRKGDDTGLAIHVRDSIP